MKKVYLFITVLFALIISYSMAATYTATEQDKTNVNAYVNKVSTLIDSKLKKTATNKQATVVQSTLKSLRFVGKGSAARNAALTEMAKEQIQSQYSDILKNIPTPTSTKTPISKITTKVIANNKLMDINADGIQGANSDKIYLGRYIAGSWLSYPTDIMERGDLNLDGIINSNDICVFEKYKINMITTVPYTGPCPPNTTTTTTTQTSSCLGSINANGISNATSATYTQTLTNGSRTPSHTRTYNTNSGICTFTCQANFSRNGSTCQAIQGQGGNYDLKGDMTFLQSPTGTYIYTRIFNVGTADFPGNGQAKLYVDNILIDTYEIGSLSRVGTTYTTFEDIYGVLIPGATIGDHTAKVVVTPTDNNPGNNTKEKTFTLSLQNVDVSVDSVGVIKQTDGSYLLNTSIKRTVPSYQTTRLGEITTSTVPTIPTPFKLQIRLNNELVKEEIKQGAALNLLQSRQYLSFTHTVNTIPEENILKVKVISLLGNDNNTANNEKEYSFNKSSLESKADIMITDILVNDGLLLNANGERKMTINPMIKKSNGPDASRPYKYKIFIDNNQVFESSQYGPLTVANPRGWAPYNQYFTPGTTHTIKLQINTTQGIDPNLNNNEMTKSFTVPNIGGVPPTPPTPPTPPISTTNLENVKINNMYFVSTRPNTTTINNNGTIYLRASQNDLTAKYTSLYIKFKNEGSTLNGGGQTIQMGYQCEMYNNGSLITTKSGNINLGYTFNANAIATAMFYNNVPSGQSVQIPYDLLTTIGNKKVICSTNTEGNTFELNFTVDYSATHPLSLKTVAFTIEHVDKYINTTTHKRENIPGNISSFSDNHTTCGRIRNGINPQTGVKPCRLNKMKDLCKTVYPNTTSAILSPDRSVNSIAGRYKPNGTGPVTKAFPYVTAFKCIE